MNASEAKKLSADNQVEAHGFWLKEALENIENAAKNGEFVTHMYLGIGSFHNEDFKNELNEKGKLIRNLGYRTVVERITSWNTIFSKTFDYFLVIKWD